MSEASVWQSVFSELRRRKVFRVATLYVVILWPLIQLVDILQPMFRYPDSVISTLLYLFIGGFPLALALAWLFDLTRDGIVRTQADGGVCWRCESAGKFLGLARWNFCIRKIAKSLRSSASMRGRRC